MIQYVRFRMTDEMLQTELWENREQWSLFLRVPFEPSHLHQPSLNEAELRLGEPLGEAETNPKGKAGAAP